MTDTVVVVDYGMGNLHSVHKALVRVGALVQVSSDPKVVAGADRLVVPGVGAFGDAMQQLRSLGLVEPIRRHIHSGRPFFGICLGLQILFDVGYEDGEHTGLGMLAGNVVRFPDALTREKGLKIPHMGWNQLEVVRPEPVLAGIPNGTYVYFVHSYYPVPANQKVVATRTDYGGPFTSAVAINNIFAVQFHPEKSQAVGLRILQNFLRL